VSNDLPAWSSDTPISMPQPAEDQVLIPMFGFGMTRMGLVHDLTDAEFERLRTPSYSPDLPTGEMVRDDKDVD
jgi:hypothetical protein